MENRAYIHGQSTLEDLVPAAKKKAEVAFGHEYFYAYVLFMFASHLDPRCG